MDESFTALERQMVHLRTLTDNYSGCVSSVRWTASQVGKGHATFSAKVKKDIEKELAEAAVFVDAMCAVSELRAQIEHAKGLVAAAEPYVHVPKPAPAPKVEEKGYRVIRQYAEYGYHGLDTHQIRMYDDSDPRGKYQHWMGQTFIKTLTEEEALAPSPSHAEWTMSEEECKKAGLHARLGELKLLCTHAGDRVCGDGFTHMHATHATSQPCLPFARKHHGRT